MKDTEEREKITNSAGVNIKYGSRLIWLAAGIIVAAIEIFIFSRLLFTVNNQNGAGKTDVQVSIIKEEKAVETEAEKPAEPQEDIEAEENQGIMLVAVPADYMQLRQTPGLGDDGIAEVQAGQYLLWNGETVEDGGRKFCKVTVEETGQEGYLNEEYCVIVTYRNDPSALSVVDVTDALYTYDNMCEDIDDLCETYKECLSYETVGESADGRKIYEVQLGASGAEHHIFVQAAIHGREYMTAQLVMRMLEYYAVNYDIGSYGGKTYRELLEHTAIHVIPMANPDGVTISQLGAEALKREELGELVYECYQRDKEDLVWEKDAMGDMNWIDYYKQKPFDRSVEGKAEIISFEDYQKIWKSNANGVDLNVNFDADWEQIEARSEPAYASYKGLYAESEPETQVLVRESGQRIYDYFLSYHSKGQLIYYDVNGNQPQTSEKSYALASVLQEIIKYQPVNTQKGYNVNLGGFSDWVQLVLQGTSVTIENGRHPCPLDIAEFDAIWYRNRESWAMLCEGLYE